MMDPSIPVDYKSVLSLFWGNFWVAKQKNYQKDLVQTECVSAITSSAFLVFWPP
jgi:hypothetical protein